MVQEFCQSRRASCTVSYQGSLDIALGAQARQRSRGRRGVARGLDLDRHVRHRAARQDRQVDRADARHPRRQRRRRRRWAGSAAKVTTKDILAAVEGGRLKFLMTSATQSNSGASAYLAMLAAGIGKPDLIESGDLDKPEVLATVRGLLARRRAFRPGRADGSPISTATASGPARITTRCGTTRPSSRRPTTS